MTSKRCQPIPVLFVLPSLATGGAEMQTVDLINGLARAGFRPHLFCFEPGTALQTRLDGSVVTQHFAPRRHRFDMSAGRAIGRVIEQHDIQVVYCTLMLALFYGWLGVRCSTQRPPIVSAIHTTLNRSRKADVLDVLVYQWILRTCRKIVFACWAQREHWCDRFPAIRDNSVAVYNGIDAQHFSRSAVHDEAARVREALRLPEGPLLLHVGAFRPEKGHRILVDALRILRERGAAVNVVFAGDGNLRPEIEQHVASLGLTEYTRFLGVVSDIRPLLAIADLSVQPSTAETFSMAMLESFAMETPMVATDVGGTRELVVPQRTGYLVRPGDPQALADELERALADKTSWPSLGQAGRMKVMGGFQRQQMIDGIAAILNDVVSNAKSS